VVAKLSRLGHRTSSASYAVAFPVLVCYGTDIHVVYLILQEAAVEVSKDGGDFMPHALREQLQFYEAAVLSDEHMTFTRGLWRFRVRRKDVIMSVQGSGYGWNEFWV